ncbi:MAG TPA: transketolase C-terminal domain-containing protein, partial [Spirochaetia bacterium]|nr:transketolase C-terminal domain-containing protein [Spirochaetia bacterium]
GPGGGKVARCIEAELTESLPALLADLGGHDLGALLDALGAAERETRRPSVIFAYTIKGWRLPIAADPFNHSALVSAAGMEGLARDLGIRPDSPWDAFDPGSEEGRWCRDSAQRLGLVCPGVTVPSPRRQAAPAVLPSDIPVALPADESARSVTSTQEALGRTLVRLAGLPGVGERIVTSSPDVSVSTGLASWINLVGRFSSSPVTDYEAGRPRVVNWNDSRKGRHIELGISEMNLFTLLGQLGLSHEMNGQILFPVGTLYDPFVCRGLDALIFGLYSGSRFIFAGTPSGVSLSPEGGAHQSSVTAALGMELPALDYFEPCFAREVEWALLEGLRQCADREHGRSCYLRLSTKPVDQALMAPALARLGEEALRRATLAGGYVLRDTADERARAGNTAAAGAGRGAGGTGAANGAPLVHLVTCGAMVPEAVEAAEYLSREGVAARVIHLTSPRRAREDWMAHRGDGWHVLAGLIPAGQRHAPVITVQDGASSALAWVGGVFGQPTTPLGVCHFGQSGSRQDLYRCMAIDVESIVSAAFDAVDRSEAAAKTGEPWTGA